MLARAPRPKPKRVVYDTPDDPPMVYPKYIRWFMLGWVAEIALVSRLGTYVVDVRHWNSLTGSIMMSVGSVLPLAIAIFCLAL